MVALSLWQWVGIVGWVGFVGGLGVLVARTLWRMGLAVEQDADGLAQDAAEDLATRHYGGAA